MEHQNNTKSVLKSLETLELVGITFIRDYIQFLFDGPLFNTYTLPQVKINDQVLSSTDKGYCDVLCSLIGKVVTSAFDHQTEERIILQFGHHIALVVSLKFEDRNSAEAAMFRTSPEGEWNVW